MYRILIFAGIFSLLTIAGCSSLTEKVILDGAVAAHSDNRIHVAGRQPLKDGAPGEDVIIYQRIEQRQIEPYRKNPWRLLKPVGTGTIAEVTEEGAWVTVKSGDVAPHGETQLRKPRR